jgi:hypothetical protein
VTENIVGKNFKSDDWNVRKLCVDISYALLVIDGKINEVLYHNVIELKYDKIKFVRDSVSNYTTLYRQINGNERDI